jgi:hypothetical protein
MALLFLIANRGAYKGYFQDDELDNLSWAPQISNATFAQALLTPKFLSHNFRPVGHYYFHLMGLYGGLNFPQHLIPIHALHFLNVWLLWMIVRRMGVAPFGATAGCLFFAFHMAVFDVYWKPMYVFDLLCTTFCLLSFLCYIERRLLLSFVAFWLAYKSKELAVMLPAVLLCYEFWLGKRRWKPLVPFFMVSLSFGLQALLLNKNENNDYTFHFGPLSVFKSARFYASAVLLVPFAGFALPVLPFFTRDRRVWFGIATMSLFFLPLAFLRERTFTAYCYLPLVGLAVAAAAICETRHRGLVAIFFLLWIPWNEFNLRLNRRHALAVADENRAYVSAVAEAARANPDTRLFVYDGAPSSFHRWGIEGALRLLYHAGDIRLVNIEDRDAQKILQSDRVLILSWDAPTRKLSVTARAPGVADVSYITMDRRTPLWQLIRGWYPLENTFRWIQPDAMARLRRPADARRFELIVNTSPEQIREIGHTEVNVKLDGIPIGPRQFSGRGWQTARWDLPPAREGVTEVEFHVTPAYRAATDPRVLGVAVVAFGFAR